MALIKEKLIKGGFTANYWKIVGEQTFYALEETCVLTFALYKDEATRRTNVKGFVPGENKTLMITAPSEADIIEFPKIRDYYYREAVKPRMVNGTDINYFTDAVSDVVTP